MTDEELRVTAQATLEQLRQRLLTQAGAMAVSGSTRAIIERTLTQLQGELQQDPQCLADLAKTVNGLMISPTDSTALKNP